MTGCPGNHDREATGAEPGNKVSRAPALLVAMALFMESLDGTILANAMPSMAPDFGVAPVELKITVTAYLIAIAMCIPISGAVARRVGAVRLFSASIALFAFASFACALSTGLVALTLARIVQGAAAAMMLPVGRLLVLRDLPKQQLVHIIAVLTWPALLAPMIAPPLAGLIVEYATWHWIFLINLPVGLAGAVLAPRLLPAMPAEPPAGFDRRGFVMWALGTGLLVGGLGEAASLPAGATMVIVLICLALAVLFARHLARAPDPLFEIAPLRILSFAHTLTGGSLVRMAIFAIPFLLPLMFQIGLDIPPVEAGVLILLGMVGNIGMKPLTTPLLQRFAYRSILLVNGVLLSAGLLLFTLIGPDTPRAALIALLVATGMARSMHFTALNTLAFREVPSAQMSGANLLASSVQQINAALGVAIGAFAVELWAALFGPGGATDLGAFHFAFTVVAVMSLIGTLDAVRLPDIRATGSRVTKERTA